MSTSSIREKEKRSHSTRYESSLNDNPNRKAKDHEIRSKIHVKEKSNKKHSRYHPFHGSRKSKGHDTSNFYKRSKSSDNFSTGCSESFFNFQYTEVHNEVDEEQEFTSYDYAEYISANTLNEKSWLEHLFEVMAEDDEDFSSTFYAESDLHGVNDMSEEDYANYIRKGMYEKQHEQELKEQRKREEKLRKKEEEKKRMMDRLRAEEKEREIREQEKKTHLKREKRALYLTRWNQFDVKGNSIIEFKDIPWPVDDITQLTRQSIEEFLLSGIKSDSEVRSILRREQIRFHPDRWHRFVKRIPTDKQWKKIMNTVTEVSRMLNVLIEEKA
ncbi:4951_t:CDS:1 [Acaulospora colombiana]|uniref:4951_t:CDS:1 n=1 Tax=Acaulospora colombiana TaxID=27376 RepID=A0ACA9LUF3_9GLOM|nr:4951_t:CDS:1 [Acaulospora colombiana]